MSHRPDAQVVTANHLLSGEAVWLTEDDRWSPRHEEAELLEDEAHAALRLLTAQARAGEVVGAYLAAARPGPHGPEPVHFREVFRTRGPSNRHHGKQEHLQPAAREA